MRLVRLASTGTRRIIALSLLVSLGVASGCGRGEESARRGRRNAEEARARATRVEAAGDPAEAHLVYREAARRYPTAAWAWSGVARSARDLGRWSEAEDAFAEAYRWDSTAVDVQRGLAELALRRGDHEEALHWVDRALAAAGESAPLLALRGRTLAERGRYPEGVRDIARAAVLAPDAPEVGVASAYAYAAADSLADALAIVKDLTRSHPQEPSVWVAQAQLLELAGDVESAVAGYTRGLSLRPRQPAARLELARLLLAGGKVREAEHHFRVILGDSPAEPAALEGLGTCALDSGELEEAEEAFRRAIASDPEFAPAHLALGRFLARSGRLDDAVAHFRRARARASLDTELWERCSLALGEAYLQMGEAAHALDTAERILVRIPESLEGRGLRARALAVAGLEVSAGKALERIASDPDASRDEILAFVDWLLAQGDDAAALPHVDRLLAADPRDALARVRHAEILANRGRSGEAEAELHEIIGQEEQPPAAHAALARLYSERGRFLDAVHHAQIAESLAPLEPDYPVLSGLALWALHRPNEAREAFERERALRPRSPEPYLHLGQLELELGDAAIAVEHLRRADELDPVSWQAMFLLGVAEAAAGRPGEAARAYREVLARNERVLEAHNNLAWLLADGEIDPVLAGVHARRAVELGPDNPHALGTLGWVQYKNDRLEDAAATLERAARLAPQDPLKHYMLGVVRWERGDLGPARAELEEALRLNPQFEKAAHARELLETLDG
jgi:tetratricopeptide (TPR) repeat protein